MRLFRFLSVVVFLFTVSGCGQEEAIPVIPADGTLTIDGTPAANVMVRFVPNGEELLGRVSSTGVTDEQGHFHLVATDGRDGAIAGPGHVLIVDMDEERPAQGEESVKTPRFSSGYNVLGPGSLTAEVVAGSPMKINVVTR